MNPLLRAAIAGLTLVTSTALPSTASAQRSGGARPAIQNFPNQSAGGSLFLTKPGPVVLGQPIDVALQVPLLPAELKDKPVFFRWYVAKTAPDARMPGRVAIGGDTDVSPRPAQTPTAANAPRRLRSTHRSSGLTSTNFGCWSHRRVRHARLLGRLTVDVKWVAREVKRRIRATEPFTSGWTRTSSMSARLWTSPSSCRRTATTRAT